jgi:hypothetical protein
MVDPRLILKAMNNAKIENNLHLITDKDGNLSINNNVF